MSDVGLQEERRQFNTRIRELETELAALRSACQALVKEMREWCDPNWNVPDADDEFALVTRWAKQLAHLSREAPDAEAP